VAGAQVTATPLGFDPMIFVMTIEGDQARRAYLPPSLPPRPPDLGVTQVDGGAPRSVNEMVRAGPVLTLDQETAAGVSPLSYALSRGAERHSLAPSIRICLNPEWVPARPTPVSRATSDMMKAAPSGTLGSRTKAEVMVVWPGDARSNPASYRVGAS
jgi:hypothetical protein